MTEEITMCPHDRISTGYCEKCAEDEIMGGGLCKSEPEIQAYLKRLNKTTTCVGSSAERSDCFLHDEKCRHRGCESDNRCQHDSVPGFCMDCLMGKKDPQHLAEYWLERFLNAEKEAKTLREIVAEYDDLLSRLLDLFSDKDCGRRLSDAAEEVEDL